MGDETRGGWFRLDHGGDFGETSYEAACEGKDGMTVSRFGEWEGGDFILGGGDCMTIMEEEMSLWDGG